MLPPHQGRKTTKKVAQQGEEKKRAKKVPARAEARAAIRGFSPIPLETSESSDESYNLTISRTESALVLKAIKKLGSKIDHQLHKMYSRLMKRLKYIKHQVKNT